MQKVSNDIDRHEEPGYSPIGEKHLSEEEDIYLSVADLMVSRAARGLVCRSMVAAALADFGLPDPFYIRCAVEEIERQGVTVHRR